NNPTNQNQAETNPEGEVPDSKPEAASEEDALVKLQAENAELRDKFIRKVAEFDNFKKRTIRERIEMMDTAAQDTLRALLPVLDDFDRMNKLSEEQKDGPAFREGVELIHQKLTNILKQRGLEAMETDGQPFDPELHEALTEVPAPSEDMKGKVMDTVEKGYTLKGKIIRHAKVVTGK
ncbi:MAG: nucleotide exchange factor GrpE, partial [Bacteroidetes bacterium]